MTDLIPAARPVESPEDRMRAARTDREYADRIPAPRPLTTDRTNSHHRDLHQHIAGLENDLRSQNRAVLEVTAERDRHRQELGAAGEVLAVVRDAAERIDRALAVYDTTPGETCSPPCTLPKGHPMECDANQQPHEDPSRLREQLAEAHADCARYATERDEARAENAKVREVAQTYREVMVEQHEWAGHLVEGECAPCIAAAAEWDGDLACDEYKRWQQRYEAAMGVYLPAAAPSSVPPRRAQESPPCRGCLACSDEPAEREG